MSAEASNGQVGLAENQRQEANNVYAGIRTACVTLLETYGAKTKMPFPRLALNTFLNAVSTDTARAENREAWPIGATTFIQEPVLFPDGTTREIRIETSSILPVKKAGIIQVLVMGENEHLELLRGRNLTTGRIRSHKQSSLFTEQISDFPADLNHVEPWNRTKTGSLPEATEWQKIIHQLKFHLIINCNKKLEENRIKKKLEEAKKDLLFTKTVAWTQGLFDVYSIGFMINGIATGNKAATISGAIGGTINTGTTTALIFEARKERKKVRALEQEKAEINPPSGIDPIS
jgi:hypothetical protein